MMFRRAGLNDKEIDIMKNGPKSHYDVVEEFLEIIQPKLDAIFLKKPREEVENEYEDMMVSFGTREEIATLLSSILTDLAEEVA